jgi:hypothetical protein
MDEDNKKTNQAVLNALSIEVLQRPLDTFVQASIKEVYILDHIMKFYCQEGEIIFSKVDPNSSESTDLVSLEITAYDEKHPNFQKNLNQSEFKLVFNQLDIMWVPDRIFYLIEFYQKFRAARKEALDQPHFQKSI